MRDNKGRFTSEASRENNYNWKGGMVEVLCSNCGSTIHRHPHRLIKTKHHFCSFSCKGMWQRDEKNFGGNKHPNWKGGVIIDKSGYVQIHKPHHNRARKDNGYVYEHILVAEKKYGRSILVGEHIHHLNGVKNDNRPENLLLTTNSEHDKFSYIHGLQDRIRELEKL